MTSPLRVLLVEDSPTDAKLVTQALRSAGHDVEIERVENAEAMRAAFESKAWDIVISDWSMPKFSALAALAIVKEKDRDLPFIIVSGTVGENLAVDAMRAGAHDYVLKDNLSRLAPAVERELRERRVRETTRATEEALRASEFRFARLSESGILGVVVGDHAGTLYEANDAWLGIVGYSREDFVAGKIRWLDLTPPEWSEATARGIGELNERGVATPYEKEYFHKSGKRVPVLVGMASIGESHSIVFVVDLTLQKRAEEALRRTEEQFRQAQKMEAVGRLAGGIAHDFNNLLSVIMSYSAMVTADLLPGDPMRADIEEIGEAGRRAADLTRQLLMFSRQEVVEPKVVNLNDAIDGMRKMLPRLLGEDIEFVTTCAPSLGRIRVDPSHVEQVIMNLAVNARDAMPTGGKLTIETANVELDETFALGHHGVTAGPYVMVAVSDTGTGMDKATQARIFEPFFTTKEQGKGTGLGLSTVFGIAKQCGGSVWVYSEPGKGTAFKVYFPWVDAPLDASLGLTLPTLADGTETILLVEDEDRVRAVAVGILRKRSYHVLEARNGGEALLLCESHKGEIHLLLTDVVMPKMSGPELAKRLVKERPAMKVLCMSGYTDDAVVRHGALEAGIAFLQKPFTPVTLAAKVRSVLDA